MACIPLISEDKVNMAEGITTLSWVRSQLDGKVGQLAAAPSCLPLSSSHLHPMPALKMLFPLLVCWSASPAGRWVYGHMILEWGKGKHRRKILNLPFKFFPRATMCKNSVPNMESSNEAQTKNECSTVSSFIVYGNLNRICVWLLYENCINLNYIMLFRSTVFFFFSLHSFY